MGKPVLDSYIIPASVVENISMKSLSDKLVELFDRKLYYFPEIKQFAKYADGIWMEITDEEVTKKILEFLDSIFQSTHYEARPKIAKFYSKSHLTSLLHTLKSRLLAPIPYAKFEPDDNILPFRNCKVVFHNDGSFSIRNLHFTDYITKCFEFDFNEKTPEPQAFLDFLSEIFLGDEKIVKFVLNALAYSLLPWNLELLFICHGGGNNGKTTFLNTLVSVLKPFSATIDAETILNSSFSKGPREDVARLRGIRFVSCSELPARAVLDEKLIKNLTGRDPIAARFLYKGTFEFEFKGKIWLSTNNLPKFSHIDKAIERRLLVIPFSYNVPPEKRVLNMEKFLSQERISIVNTLVKIASEVNQKIAQQNADPLEIPSVVLDNTLESFEGTHPAYFVIRKYFTYSNTSFPLLDVYNTFTKLFQQNFEQPPPSKREFSKLLQSLNFRKSIVRDKVFFNICLK